MKTQEEINEMKSRHQKMMVYNKKNDPVELARHCSYLFCVNQETEKKHGKFLEEIKMWLLEGKSSAFILMEIMKFNGEFDNEEY